MRFSYCCSVLALALALVGCSAIRSARETQSAVEGKAAGVVEPSARLDLRGYSLERLVGFAMTNRPSVVSARLTVESERLKLRQLASNAPIVSDTPWTAAKLDLTGNYAEQNTPGTTFRDHNWRTFGDPTAGLSLELLIWDFGRYSAQSGAQAKRVVAAEQKLADEGFSVFYEVSNAYFSHLRENALLGVALTREREYADNLARAEGRLKVGEAKELDVLRARLDLASAREQTVSASNLVLTTGADLMKALGVVAAQGTCENVLGLETADCTFVISDFRQTDYDSISAFGLARTNAPSVRVVRTQLAAASKDVDYAVADLLPNVSAKTTLNWTDPLWMWKWGFYFAESIFQGFGKETAVRQAVVALKLAEQSVDTAEQQLSRDIEAAVANRDNALNAQITAQVRLASARENLDMVRRQLDVGDVSRVEMTEAVAIYTDALGNGITAFYKGQIAEAQLCKLCGVSPQFDEKRKEYGK